MKTCPVCHAKTFDDAETCYGCMHRFSEDDNDVHDEMRYGVRDETCDEMCDDVCDDMHDEMSEEACGEMRSVDMPPEFRIRFVPVREGQGAFTWKCAVEA